MVLMCFCLIKIKLILRNLRKIFLTFSWNINEKKISEIKLNELKNISFIDNIEEISVSDVVIEAVFEEFEVKILSEVNKIVGKNLVQCFKYIYP